MLTYIIIDTSLFVTIMIILCSDGSLFFLREFNPRSLYCLRNCFQHCLSRLIIFLADGRGIQPTIDSNFNAVLAEIHPLNTKRAGSIRDNFGTRRGDFLSDLGT